MTVPGSCRSMCLSALTTLRMPASLASSSSTSRRDTQRLPRGGESKSTSMLLRPGLGLGLRKTGRASSSLVGRRRVVVMVEGAVWLLFVRGGCVSI